MVENSTEVFGLIGSLGLILGAVWGHSLWLSKQFNFLKDLIHHKVATLEDIILSKLEYHERHDDKRFSDLHNELWEMKLRNAAFQGMFFDTKKTREKKNG